jgi:hypothetical protein
LQVEEGHLRRAPSRELRHIGPRFQPTLRLTYAVVEKLKLLWALKTKVTVPVLSARE